MGLWLPCTIPEATLYFFEHNQTQESNWTLAIHIFLSFLEAVGAGAAACRPPRRGPAAAELRGDEGHARIWVSGREWGPSALVLHLLRDQSRKRRHFLTPGKLLHPLWAKAAGAPQPNRPLLSRRRTGSHGSCGLPLSCCAGALSRAPGGGITNGWEQAGGRWAGPLLLGRRPAHFRRAALPGEGAWPGSEVWLVQATKETTIDRQGCSDHGVQRSPRADAALGTDTRQRCAVPAAPPGGRRPG